MRDILDGDWGEMAEFSNAITAMIDNVNLSPAEIIVVLDMISVRLRQLLELKKAG